MTRFKRKLLFYTFAALLAWSAYYYFWGQYLYVVTAYCGCPICINVKSYRDGRFASGHRVYWGGAATDPAIPFGSDVTLLPHWPQDWLGVFAYLSGRRDFVAEDRGGKIKGRHIDLFIPDSLGGHAVARRWGVRRMRIKINGELAK
ncbi:MAG: hypothetical protein A3J52_00030 [Omnitrophica bacterium RIFCSPHIGHO2_02_FULL_49_9]|nr:MAG: hypothetical protein A3J52_00030 [Omnitrophica bacterium RIFCSPHIGHO2_02_FULL_49_9]